MRSRNMILEIKRLEALYAVECLFTFILFDLVFCYIANNLIDKYKS